MGKLFFGSYLSPEERFKLFFDIEIGPASEIWSWIDKAIIWAQNRRPWKYDGANYLPFGAVDRVLRVLEKIRPEDFTIGRIIWHELPANVTITSQIFTIVLPRIAEAEKFIEHLKNNLKEIREYERKIKTNSQLKETFEKCYNDSRLILARYAATAVLNQRMAYGPGLLDLAFDADQKTAKAWHDAIRLIEERTKQPPAKAGGFKLRTESPDTGPRPV